MRGEILCPYCRKILGKYEDVHGDGELYLYCKRCKKERRILIKKLSLDN